MSVRIKATKSSLVTLTGNGLSYGLSFIRNMILARLLTKADFGAAATLGMVLGLFELTAKMGIARFVVQDKDGDRPEFIATIHMFQGLVGLISGAIILGATPFLATLFNLPGPVWIVMVLSLVPLFRGFEHVDIRRYERNLRFFPSNMVEVIPQGIITACAWPIATWLPDFRSVLILMIGKSFLSFLMSHFLSEQPYKWGWQREYASRMLHFGWPLLLTGFLMFGIFQGDQFIVATFYNLADLAPYAAASALVMVPGMLFGNVINSVALPVLAQVQEDRISFKKRYHQVMSIVMLFSVATTVGIILGSESIMRLAYGDKYVGSGVILAWLSASIAFRNLRMAPALAALAQGDSKNSLISNIGRATALIPALGIALSSMPIWLIAASGLLGEFVACWLSMRRLETRDKIPFSESNRSIMLMSLIVSGAGFASWSGVHNWPMPLNLLAAVMGSLVSSAIVIIKIPEMRKEACSLWKGFRIGGWHGAWLSLRDG